MRKNFDIDQLIHEVIQREGGFVDHPADRGGATRWGITRETARIHGYTGPMQALSRDQAAEIYRQSYWVEPQLHKLSDIAPRLSAELFDTGINMGTGTAAGYLQRALNALNRNQADYADLIIDRRIGSVTLGALVVFMRKRGPDGEAVLIKAVEALQGAHYLRLAETKPSQEAFLFGWLNSRIGNTGPASPAAQQEV